METINILAFSGSLRQGSYNTAAIEALQILAPDRVEITKASIGDLPLFNPDREGECIPSLQTLTQALKQADGLVIASPEYAHGISGPMKNALDWLVSGVDFPYKPIMLINTSPRASHAQASLREVLKTMSGTLIDRACVAIPLLSSGLDAQGIIEDQDISGMLMHGLNELCSEVRAEAPLNKSL